MLLSFAEITLLVSTSSEMWESGFSCMAVQSNNGSAAAKASFSLVLVSGEFVVMGVINTLGVISVSWKGTESHQSSPRHDCSAGLFSLSLSFFAIVLGFDFSALC